MSSSPDFSVTRVGETDATSAPVITSTVRSASALVAYSRSFGLNIENSSGPASTRITRAWSCGDVRVVGGEVRAVELGDRAGRLDSGRPAADDDDVQRAVLDQARVAVGGLPALEQVVLEADRVRQRVHRERVLGARPRSRRS